MKTLEKRQRLARCPIELSVCYVFHGAGACLNTNYPLPGRKYGKIQTQLLVERP